MIGVNESTGNRLNPHSKVVFIVLVLIIYLYMHIKHCYTFTRWRQ
ncbi:hypothetical protein BMETH_2442_1 [methanotrophic bacterial endosymbiont of Bathymodiolus sp.]|nr:hypothetical protein BMETH_2442_1 [methanotrophic bacterial endosymbiont of Bathymodiolus sp.]